jgi:hypothetical protein
MTEKPRGYHTLAELLSAIADYERAKRRAISEAPWPCLHLKFFQREPNNESQRQSFSNDVFTRRVSRPQQR